MGDCRSGHVDAAIVTFAALALAAAVSGRRVWSAVPLAAATLVKFFPLVLAPALWRPAKSNFGDWRWPAAFIAVIVAAYLPYIGVGSRALGFLPGYVAEENLGSGGGSGFSAWSGAPLPYRSPLILAWPPASWPRWRSVLCAAGRIRARA